MGLEISDMVAFFARGKAETIRTEAENAWLEGKDAKDNPYRDKEVFYGNYYLWNKYWIECNKYG
jgi:hypothetical protein